ncbi:hypothetical protein [Pseudomonas sp. GM84]|uniref:hypothetical protein n=1 Tax=Pseudomonas sp. GM84 TaxID=1144340 RepID=UPI0012FA02C8|nr:hypothetical protein [Pseudomonas sp. GM84]
MPSEPPVSTELRTIFVINISRSLPERQRHFHPDETEWFVSIHSAEGLTTLLVSCGIQHALKIVYPHIEQLSPAPDVATENVGGVLYSQESLGATTKDNMPELITHIFNLEISRTLIAKNIIAGEGTIQELTEYRRCEKDLQSFCQDLIEDIEYELYVRFERMVSASNDTC